MSARRIRFGSLARLVRAPRVTAHVGPDDRERWEADARRNARPAGNAERIPGGPNVTTPTAPHAAAITSRGGVVGGNATPTPGAGA